MEEAGNAGCLCGAIRFRIEGAPATVLQCHCIDCQKSTGDGAVLAALMPKTAVTLLRGQPSGHSVTGASGGRVTRRFCPDCGSPLYSELDKYPDLLAVKSGVWDEDQGLRPALGIWIGSAPAWHSVPDDVDVYRHARP